MKRLIMWEFSPNLFSSSSITRKRRKKQYNILGRLIWSTMYNRALAIEAAHFSTLVIDRISQLILFSSHALVFSNCQFCQSSSEILVGNIRHFWRQIAEELFVFKKVLVLRAQIRIQPTGPPRNLFSQTTQRFFRENWRISLPHFSSIFDPEK